MQTVTLLGDGRHPKALRFTWEGQTVLARFGPAPDYKVSIEGYGEDIPVALAEYIYNLEGSGVRIPGYAPIDAKKHEAESAKRRQEHNDRLLRGELTGAHKDVAPMPKTGTILDTWPTPLWSYNKLVAEAALLGVRPKNARELEYNDLLTLVRDKKAKAYPGLAEQAGWKG